MIIKTNAFIFRYKQKEMIYIVDKFAKINF